MKVYKKAIVFFLTLFLNIIVLKAQINNFDNRELLEDQRVNRQFAQIIKSFLDSASKRGFNPVIHEAFRTMEKAQSLNKKNKDLNRPAALISVHSFGMAADIWLKNDLGEEFSFDPVEYKKNHQKRFSYSKWIEFIKIGESFGLVNAYKHDDTDHWEYHPKWNKYDWVSAKKYALPIYNKYPDLSEIGRLQKIWEAAGLAY